MALKQMNIALGSDGESTLSAPTSNDINGVLLAANVAESITIPSGSKFAMFNATADFYANYSTTAAVISDTTDGTGSELNPTVRTLASGDTISVISGEVCRVTVAFYD